MKPSLMHLRLEKKRHARFLRYVYARVESTEMSILRKEQHLFLGMLLRIGEPEHVRMR